MIEASSIKIRVSLKKTLNLNDENGIKIKEVPGDNKSHLETFPTSN